MRFRIGTIAALLALGAPQGAMAGDLVYSPVNPSFGGNPLNSAHLLGLAAAQREATASDADDDEDDGGSGGGTGTPTSPGSSDADLFIRQLQGRLFSALASQVTDAIFGENPQDSGTVQFGDTTVEFERGTDGITLRITDAEGTVTVIKVPTLVTADPDDTGASTLSAARPNSPAAANGSSLFQESLSKSLSSQSLN